MNSSVATHSDRRALLAAAFQLLREGKIGAAMDASGALIARYPDDAECQFLALEVRLANGQPEIALGHAERACELAPGQWPLTLRRAEVLLALRRRTDFRSVAAEARRLAGNDPRALWAIGNAYLACDDANEARTMFEAALASGAESPGLHMSLAHACLFTGDLDGAERSANAALAQAPAMGEALHLRSTLRRARPEHHHVDELRGRLQGLREPRARAAACYALAKELEDLGRESESIEALREGASLMASVLNYSVQPELDAMAVLRETFSEQALAELPVGDDGEGAIFVVGMPRTGTTLVERMLSNHPRVRSAGELLDFKALLTVAIADVQQQQAALSSAQAALLIDLPALGREYMRGAREAARGSEVFVDKMPVNFLYCGLIAKALPKARIVHLVRDPMDSCYAVFKTLFQNAYFFSYDQTHLADYYSAYRGLMAHWRSVLPGRILDVQYELLVEDTEAEARRLLEFCGLEWTGAVLNPDENEQPTSTASAVQVREPVHSRSVGRWRTVAEGLRPLLERLQSHAVVDAEGSPR